METEKWISRISAYSFGHSNSSNMRRGILIAGITVLGIIGSASMAHAATLYLSPSFSTAPAAGQFSMDVKLDSEGAAINAAEGEIQFDPSLVQFVSADLGGSAFSLWLAEPALSPSGSTITFTGGTPKGTAGARTCCPARAAQMSQSGPQQYLA